MLIHNSHATEHGPDNPEIALICARDKEILKRRSAALDLDRTAVYGSAPLFRKPLNGHGRKTVLKHCALVVLTKGSGSLLLPTVARILFELPVLLFIVRRLLPEFIIGRIGHPHLDRGIAFPFQPSKLSGKQITPKKDQ